MTYSNKDEIVNHIDRDYLERVASGVNNSLRTDYHTYNNDEFQEYIKNKFTINELMSIWQDYMLYNSPNTPAKKIRNISASEIINQYKSANPDYDFYIEHRIDGSRCDLIQAEPSSVKIHAIEVKSNADDLRKAHDQCMAYAKWANRVSILTQSSHIDDALDSLPDWIGCHVINEDVYKKVRQPDSINHSISDLIRLLTKSQLQWLLRTSGLEFSGTRSELEQGALDNLKEISESEVRKAMLAD